MNESESAHSGHKWLKRRDNQCGAGGGRDGAKGAKKGKTNITKQQYVCYQCHSRCDDQTTAMVRIAPQDASESTYNYHTFLDIVLNVSSSSSSSPINICSSHSLTSQQTAVKIPCICHLKCVCVFTFMVNRAFFLFGNFYGGSNDLFRISEWNAMNWRW